MSDATVKEHKRDLPDLRREELLELEKAKVFVEFAKYGFYGTLVASVGGMVFVFALALLSAFSEFKIDSWALVAITGIIVTGSIAFGSLSLWQAPKIAAEFKGVSLRMNGGTKEADNLKKASG